MTSKEVLPADAPREAWLAERRKGVGGSDVSAILGLNKYSSPREVWLDKLGLSDEKRTTWAMTKGNLLEPGLRLWYQEQTGVPVIQNGLHRNNFNEIMQYSPDGFISHDGIFEAKTGSFWVRSDWEDEQVSDHAELQVQWGFAVTGRQWADVVAAISDDEPVIRRVYRDDALITILIEAVQRFWDDYVAKQVEPPATVVDLPALNRRPYDLGRILRGNDDHWDGFLSGIEKVKSEIKALTAQQKLYETRLLDGMGDAQTLIVKGEIAATRTTVKRDGYEVKPSEYIRLTVPAAAKRKTFKEN